MKFGELIARVLRAGYINANVSAKKKWLKPPQTYDKNNAERSKRLIRRAKKR